MQEVYVRKNHAEGADPKHAQIYKRNAIHVQTELLERKITGTKVNRGGIERKVDRLDWVQPQSV